MYKRILTALLTSGLMAGSAIGEPLPEQNYQYAGQTFAGLQKCTNAGNFTNQQGLTGALVIDTWMNSWQFDKNRFNRISQSYFSSFSPNIDSCNGIGRQLASLESVLVAHEQEQLRKKQAWNSLMRTLEETAQSINNSANRALQSVNTPAPSVWRPPNSSFVPPTVFYPNECLGPVVNGDCQGTIRPSSRPKRCMGRVVNGQCIGTIVEH